MNYTAPNIIDISNWSKDAVSAKISELSDRAGLRIAEARIGDWWKTFEKDNQTHGALIIRLLEELLSIEASVSDFYNASVALDSYDIGHILNLLNSVKMSGAPFTPNKLREAANNFRAGINGISFKESIREFSSIGSVEIRWRDECEKNWSYGHLSCILDGKLQLIGTEDFLSRVVVALKLLKIKALEDYNLISKYIGQIREWYQSGITVYAIPPTFYMSRRVAFQSITWCASALAHEAHHSRLYHEYKEMHLTEVVPEIIYRGQAVELQCNKYQLLVCKKIEAPESEIDWLIKTDGSHWNLPWGDEERFY